MGVKALKQILTWAFWLAGAALWAQYPVIERLNKSDILYKQLSEDIAENYRRLASGKPLLPLDFYAYQAKEGDTLYSIAARLNIPYDSIATLNGISSPLLFDYGLLLYLPNMSGLAARAGESDLFLQTVNRRLQAKPALESSLYLDSGAVVLRYFPQEKFNGGERREFLSGFFRSPVSGSRAGISSSFGMRRDPFGSGLAQMHNGVDIKKPIGSQVLAARRGVVSYVGFNETLGHYMILNHESGFQTVYGHLSETVARQGQSVAAGAAIAKSGNSGASTGPHLHFEVRKGGRAIDPLAYFPRGF